MEKEDIPVVAIDIFFWVSLWCKSQNQQNITPFPLSHESKGWIIENELN
jgi:hypothetical protein